MNSLRSAEVAESQENARKLSQAVKENENLQKNLEWVFNSFTRTVDTYDQRE